MRLTKILIMMLLSAIIVASSFGQNLLTNPESVVFDSLNERYLVANWADGIVAVEYDLTQSHFKQGIGTRVAGMFIVGDTVFISTENLRGYNLNTGDEVVNIFIAGANLDGKNLNKATMKAPWVTATPQAAHRQRGDTTAP